MSTLGPLRTEQHWDHRSWLVGGAMPIRWYLGPVAAAPEVKPEQLGVRRDRRWQAWSMGWWAGVLENHLKNHQRR